MSKTTALKAFKFFKRHHPFLTFEEVQSIVGLISMVNTLKGAYFASRLNEEYDKPLPEGAAKKVYDDIEMMFGPKFSVDYALFQLFGINRDKEKDFDPVELSDGLNWDKSCRKLFGVKD